MLKKLAETNENELRPEYDLAQLGGGVRGKYYRRARAGTNLVLIEPDLAKAFPDQESVNRALRLLVTTASAATHGSRGPHKARKGRMAPNQQSKRGHSGK